MMKIIAWNINSIRKRLKLLETLIQTEKPDIICLQETKVINELFPTKIFDDYGFPYLFYRGDKGYSGVAIASKIGSQKLANKDFVNKEARDLAITLSSSIDIHNLYVPSGAYEADMQSNPKFAQKIEYMGELINWTKNNVKPSTQAIFLGDINIAPLEHDVWSHNLLLKEVSHTPLEIELFKKWQKSGNLVDVPREFIRDEHKLYSWWSYRNKDYKRSNRGRRLDHIMVTPNLLGSVKACYYLPEYRDFHEPSDHVPVVLELSEI